MSCGHGRKYGYFSARIYIENIIQPLSASRGDVELNSSFQISSAFYYPFFKCNSILTSKSNAKYIWYHLALKYSDESCTLRRSPFEVYNASIQRMH